MPPGETEPLWLHTNQITGHDHLGVQVVSIALYSELLPGLTNVTDRLRYYSFYPWVLHRYAKDVRRASYEPWYDHLRRADFLLALVAKTHHLDGQEGAEAVVGSETAVTAPHLSSARLRTWRIGSQSNTNGEYRGPWTVLKSTREALSARASSRPSSGRCIT